MACSLQAQVTVDSLVTGAKDTSAVVLKKQQTNNKLIDTEVAIKQNANKALLYGLLPGAGQVYNKQYGKAPIYAGAVVGLTAVTLQQRQRYFTAYNTYTNTLNEAAVGGVYDNETLADVRQEKNDARKSYSLYRSLTLAAYGCNLVDAYVSAHVLNDKQKHSPFKAGYRSALLPGFGQAYNGKYWKIPIVYTGLGLATAATIYNVQLHSMFREEYLARTHPGYGQIDATLQGYSNDDLINKKKLIRRDIELAIIAGSTWYLLNIVDAVIDAHLYDFDTSPDLSWHVSPFVAPTVPALGNTSWQGGVQLGLTF